MDDTQASATEAATRKRRSSILKSQRPPRTPLSELEFHIATPPDTTKSRRVSFSKRTGVAEFATNEATTTWKNFYEEHNRTFESSGNETAANAPRPSTIGHIGKGIFDQQFEEIEVVDIGGALQSNQPMHEFQSSLNNINFTQQLSAFELECLRDGKVTAPIQNFELSALPDQNTKVFGDERSLQISEMSNPISINFSNIKPIGGDKIDDLDEIQRDLDRPRSSVVCPAPFGANISEYIEVDLNMTNACIRNDDCDMSITDTILSPKVQAVSKSISAKDNKSNDEWGIDKENIAINPYATPKESLNFAINDVDDKVLVFDGKKLRIQSDRQPIPDVETDIASNKGAITKRKSNMQNVYDPPNFTTENLKKSVVYDNCDLSITQVIDNKENNPKRKTIVFTDNMGNISVTQVVPAKVIINEKEQRKTVIYENDSSNVSITRLDVISNSSEKRKTVVYENDISFTQALPTNLILNKTNQNKTVCYQDGLDMSVTQMIPGTISKSKLIDEDMGNISMTQVIPSNIIITNKHEFDDSNKNVTENLININEKGEIIGVDGNEFAITSVTETMPNKLLDRTNNTNKICGSQNEKRKTIVFDGNESGSISITEAIPNILIDRIIKANTTCGSQNDKRKTIVFNGNESGNISVTEAIPNILLDRINNANKTSDNQNENFEEISNRRKTIIYNKDECDISITQTIPSNIIAIKNAKSQIIASNFEKNELGSDTQKTFIYNQEEGNVSMTRVIPTKINVHEENEERCKVTLNDNNMDISVTQPLATNVSLTDNKNNLEVITFSKENITMDLTNLHQENKTLSRNSVRESIVEVPKSCNISKIPQLETLEINEIKLVQRISINDEKNEKNLHIANFPHDVSCNRDILVYHNLESKLSRSNKNAFISNDLNKYDYDFSEEIEQGNKSIQLNHSTTTLTKSVESNVGESIESNKVETDNKLIETVSDKAIENIEEEIKNSTKKDYVEISHDQKGVNINLNSKNGRQKQPIDQIFSKQDEKKSILSELLDMSNASLDDVESVKNFKNEIEDKYDQQNIEENEKRPTVAKSSDSMFIITSDSDNEINTNNIKNSVDLQICTTDQKIKSFTIRKSLEGIEDVEMDVLQNKIAELKTIDEENQKPSNRHYEKIIRSDLNETIQDVDKSLNKDCNLLHGNKSIAGANNTKDLLEMLSQLTDDNDACDGKSDMEKSHDTEKPQYNRVSIIANRKSLPLSREEILNNLSRAHEILQKSQYDLIDSIDECSDEENDSSLPETKNVSKKTVRMSTDVVKTLKFDDESIDNINMVGEIKTSPLKKTAYGEISYVKDDKTKVIPSYLEDVSDGVKSLMHDLVKPTADMPFDGNKPTKQSPSTCSTQIQANLITSSQIDIDYELISNAQSTISIGPTESMAAEISAMGNRAVAHALRHSTATADTSMEIDATPIPNSVMKTPIKDSSAAVRHQVIPGPVIMFDHLNPLNNIVLTQTDYSQAHSYNPIIDTKPEVVKVNENEVNIERLSVDLLSKNPFRGQQELQSGDGIEKIKETSSLASNDSKHLSFDRSTEGITTEVKDTEVNTSIVMKSNKDLLETNSSLTLVDDALDQPLDVSMENLETESDKTAPVRIIYKVDEDELLQNDSAFTSTDDFKINTKSKKRSYSPSKQNVTLNLPVEVTPKPLSKIQKISNSPKVQLAVTKADVDKKINLIPLTISNSPDRAITTDAQKIKPDLQKSKGNSQKVLINPKAPHASEKGKVKLRVEKNSKVTETKKKSPKKSPKQDSMVQQFIAECCIDTVKRDRNSSVTSTVETISDTLNTVKSNTTFTSSKNVLHTDTSKCSTANSEKSSAEFCEGANVVMKIDKLPFMGTRDCEWESTSGDQWTFLLLREQMRLTVRLAHALHNATRSVVRAETPIKSLIVDRVGERTREPISTTLCLRLATEAMRYECSLCRCAGDVPLLLQRCHEVSRVAALWARVMYDAKMRVAYNVTLEGDLTVKVANIPLRSIWEIHMKIELEVSEESCGAFPRATGVHVTSVISPASPSPATLARLLGQVKLDWGHVPNTLWKVFRFLKNKTKDDDLDVWGFK